MYQDIIAILLNNAYKALTELNDTEAAIGFIAEAKAIAENDLSSFDLQEF
jgi:hypothetical protein